MRVALACRQDYFYRKKAQKTQKYLFYFCVFCALLRQFFLSRDLD